MEAFPDTWDIPGGHVEEGEDLLGVLRREIREETGFAVTVDRPFYAGTFDYPSANGRNSRTVEVDFMCTVSSKREPRLDPVEHTSFAWIQRYDSRRYPAPALLRRIIRTALASRQNCSTIA